MVQWCIRQTRLTLAYEVKILKKKTRLLGLRPAIAFVYLFLFHFLLRLTPFFLQPEIKKELSMSSLEAVNGQNNKPNVHACEKIFGRQEKY